MTSMLINLSNHPYTIWSDTQQEAAKEYGEIVDLPFPEVEAAADENHIRHMADEYLQKVKQLANGRTATIHLMGEMTLTFALVKRLQNDGFSCVASTSKRIVNETEPDYKEVVFQFEKFRRYE